MFVNKPGKGFKFEKILRLQFSLFNRSIDKKDWPGSHNALKVARLNAVQNLRRCFITLTSTMCCVLWTRKKLLNAQDQIFPL